MLTVHPGELNDDIVCNLSTISLGAVKCDTFNALSYVWGNARQQQTIKLDGVPITVTANLAVALRSLGAAHHQPTYRGKCLRCRSGSTLCASSRTT